MIIIIIITIIIIIITLFESQIILAEHECCTNNFACPLSLNLCMIIAKYSLHIASRKEEECYLDAFLAILTSKIEKHKSMSQIKYARTPPT